MFDFERQKERAAPKEERRGSRSENGTAGRLLLLGRGREEATNVPRSRRRGVPNKVGNDEGACARDGGARLEKFEFRARPFQEFGESERVTRPPSVRTVPIFERLRR